MTVAALVLGVLVAVVIFGSLSADAATVLGAAIVLGIGGLGVWLLLRYPGTGWVDVGKGLVMGSIVSIAVGTGQYALEQKRKERENHDALRLTLSLTHDLRGVELKDGKLEGFFLAHKDLSEARLHNAHMKGASLVGSDLVGADLSNADLRDADLSNADLTRANLRGAKLGGANLVRAKLSLADLTRAKLEDAFLAGAKLGYACLARAGLQKAQLPGAALKGALMLGAHLEGAVFFRDQRSATLQGTALLNATEDSSTRWPPDLVKEMRDRIAGRVVAADAASEVPVPKGAETARVAAVEDGDSIKLEGIGNVRLLGLNAPDGDEPLGKVATSYLRNRLPAGTLVHYDYDVVRKDELHRWLLYVWLPDRRFLNELLVEQGYASRLDFEDDTRYVTQIANAELRARAAARNIWRTCPNGASGG